VRIKLRQGTYLEPENLSQLLRAECYIGFSRLLKDEMSNMDRKDSFIFESQSKGFDIGTVKPEKEE
jgi:hypothetical protein